MRQKGFTLLELVLALGISSLVLFTGVGVIFLAYRTTQDVRSFNTILIELDVATTQIRRDLYMAHDTDLTDGVPQNSINLEWNNYASTSNTTGAVPYSCNYALSGTNLIRTYDDSENVTVSIVGRNITNITFTQNDRFINVEITATSDARRPISKRIEFSAYRRSTGVN